jgi:outer membrane protein assembly factor BamE (lipoprotein component of BamABCDE complex)
MEINMRQIVAFLALALCLSGCVYSQTGTRFDMSKADQLTPGISTEDDAERLLGKPISVVTNPNGHQVFIWAYSYGTALAIGGGKQLVIAFDENGTMIKIAQRTEI